MVKGKNNSQGFILASILIISLIIIFIVIAALTFLIGTQGSEGTSGGKRPGEQSNNLPSKGESNNKAGQGNSNNLPSVTDESQDLSNSYLVCVQLAGISSSRTPALDKRVAQRWLAVKQDLDTQGIAPLSFTWGFRTNCQQVNVKTSYTKAKPGSSPHEAGRALDANGMSVRKDRFEIVATFKNHGWVWLGPTVDPPHFEIEGYTVGEASHANWIKKAQKDYQQGGPHGCRGPECGQ